MNRRPDVIRILVIVFTAGLLVSGLNSLAASDDDSDSAYSARISQSLAVPQSVSRSN